MSLDPKSRFWEFKASDFQVYDDSSGDENFARDLQSTASRPSPIS